MKSGCSSSAIGCGTPTARSARSPPAIHCCPGRTIPARGGETEFADMRAAYDALDDETKAEIEDLVCEHSLVYSREAIGFFDLAPEERDDFQPVRHRLVRVDTRTGRKSLFLSAHAGAIVGWTVPEARLFLRDLDEHATQPRLLSPSFTGDLGCGPIGRRCLALAVDRDEIRDVRPARPCRRHGLSHANVSARRGWGRCGRILLPDGKSFGVEAEAVAEVAGAHALWLQLGILMLRASRKTWSRA